MVNNPARSPGAECGIGSRRRWAVDRIYGPEPPTPAALKREAEHEELREAFPMIGVAGTIEVDKEPRTHVEPGRSALLRFPIRHCQDRKCQLIGLLTELASRVPAGGRKDFALAPAAQLRRLCEVVNDLTRRPSGQFPPSRP
jgi:hypothetical protein